MFLSGTINKTGKKGMFVVSPILWGPNCFNFICLLCILNILVNITMRHVPKEVLGRKKINNKQDYACLNKELKAEAFIYTCIWTASSEFGTYSLCEQRRFGRACASAQSRQNLRYSLIQAVNQEEPSDRKPDPWPL